MSASQFDLHYCSFVCRHPRCRHDFRKSLRALSFLNEVACPRCGTIEDIRDEKTSGKISKAFETAAKLDHQGFVGRTFHNNPQ